MARSPAAGRPGPGPGLWLWLGLGLGLGLAPAAALAQGVGVDERRLAVERELEAPLLTSARDVYVDAEKGTLVAGGDISIEAGRIRILADEVVASFDPDPRRRRARGDGPLREVYAFGDVHVSGLGEIIECSALFYDFEEGRGVVARGEVRARLEVASGTHAPLLLRAERILLEGELTRFVAAGAVVSTCTFEEPHYGLSAGTIRVFRRFAEGEDGAAAEGGPAGDPGAERGPGSVVFTAREPKATSFGVPFFYLPWSLSWDTAWNRYLPSVEFGRRGKFGTFVLTETPIYPGRALDLTLGLDYYSKRGIGVGPDLQYRGETFRGLVDTYYIHDGGEDDNPVTQGKPRNEDRGRVRLLHRESLPFGLRRDAEVSYISDRGFLPEYFEREFKEGKPQETYVHHYGRHENLFAALLAKWRLNDFQSDLEHLPRGRFAVISQPLVEDVLPIGHAFYLTASVEATSVRFRPDDARPDIRSARTLRGDVDLRLDYPFALGPVQVDPFGVARATTYERTLERFASQTRETAGGGAIARTDLWRDFEAASPLLGLDGLRHTATPTVGYVHVFLNTVDPDELFFFDAVDRVDENEFVLLGLRNRLATERGGRLLDVLDLDIEARYFPRPRRNFEVPGESWGLIRPDLRVTPAELFSMSARAQFDPNDDRGVRSLRRADIAATLTPEPGVSLSGGYRFLDDGFSAVTVGVDWRLTEKWGISALGQYDFEQQEFIDQRLRVRRYLHSFVLEVELGVDFGEEEDVRFSVTFLPRELFGRERPFGGDVERGPASFF